MKRILTGLTVPQPGTKTRPLGRDCACSKCVTIGVGFPKSHGIISSSQDFSHASVYKVKKKKSQ